MTDAKKTAAAEPSAAKKAEARAESAAVAKKTDQDPAKSQDPRLVEDDLSNVAAQQIVKESQYSQGEFDKDVKETEQNDPKNAPDVTSEEYGTLEFFEKKKEERLAEAKKLAKKQRES